MFTDIALCLDDSYLVSSHCEGTFSVINLQDESVQIVNEPFGQVSSVWEVEPYAIRAEGEPQIIFVPTSRGLF